MKFFRTALTIGILALAVSCGQKNETSSPSYSSGDLGSWGGGSTITENTGSTTQNIGAIMNRVIQTTDVQRPCKYGPRLPMVHFPGTAYNSNTIVVQQQSAIPLPTTTVGNYYIGVSNFGDVMVVSKTGSNYVVSVAMCSFGNTLTPDRPITKFHTQYGIVLGTTTQSSLGTIVSAKNTSVFVEAGSNYQQATWFGPTTFYPVNIH